METGVKEVELRDLWRRYKEEGDASARERLGQNRDGLFTSDLSVSEFLLITHAGFDPLGLVVGSSIYHIGLQVSSLRKNQELTVASQAMY